ncbi:MAG TPA: formate dehydrogenase subunit gamma [Rhodoblastus sp.]|nr:formate dehydrogenase subunit gamma [Rhodoblastus sp.]
MAERERVRAIIGAHRSLRGALLPILHDIQEEFGFVDPAVVPLLADGLNLSQAEVHGVLSFYHDFRATAPGRHVVKICVAEACQARGCDDLVAHVKRRLQLDFGETGADGAFTLDAVYCLGNCALGPSAEIDGALYGRLDAESFDEIVPEARS